MKLQILTTTVLLLMASATAASSDAIAASLSTQRDDIALQPASVTADDGVSYQKQNSERDRQRREELRQRERDRQRDAEQQRRDRDSDDRDDDDNDDDAPWWSSDDGWDAREQDRDRQRDARQREEDRRDLEERLDDRRDRGRDDDDRDRDDRDDDYYDNDNDDDFWRQWERQQELLQWQWNNWRSSVPSSFASSTRVDLTSLSQDAVTVAIDSINGEQALTFAGNNTQQTIDLSPGTYKVRFSGQDGDRTWQSGYLNVGRTDALRIVFDPQRRTVQVYNDPYAWTPEDSVVSSDEY